MTGYLHAASSEAAWRPSKEQLAAARDRKVADVIASGLAVLFCGINPGLYSGAVGHHFARPGNRFWRTLHESGFTDRKLSPFEENELLNFSLGITNFVNRATATAAEVSADELARGALAVTRKARRHRPRYVAVLGLSAYRTAFRRPHATVGKQPQRLGPSQVWLLPNPSGLNAHYQLPALAAAFAELRAALDQGGAPNSGQEAGRRAGSRPVGRPLS
jgi:TDG/mug DNA glycosylase family protein